MTTVDLVVDPRLAPAWSRLARTDVALRGFAGAVAAGRAACTVVTDRALTGDEVAALQRAVAEVLGVATVEVAALHAVAAEDLVRQWVNQAAQGSGRGVRVRVIGTPPEPAGSKGSLRVLVEAVDSSARELALRLASPLEPALPALRALLGGIDITVEDAEHLA